MYHGRVRTAVHRRALWALLTAKLIGGWGVGWDIRWHLVIGRDSFWIAPHVMTYASVVVASLTHADAMAAQLRGLGFSDDRIVRLVQRV